MVMSGAKFRDNAKDGDVICGQLGLGATEKPMACSCTRGGAALPAIFCSSWNVSSTNLQTGKCWGNTALCSLSWTIPLKGAQEIRNLIVFQLCTRFGTLEFGEGMITVLIIIFRLSQQPHLHIMNSISIYYSKMHPNYSSLSGSFGLRLRHVDFIQCDRFPFSACETAW